MPKRYRSASKAEATNATRSNFELFKEQQEEKKAKRLFGSTHCWKCSNPPIAQFNGHPYCSNPTHHPDPMRRPQA